MLAAQKVVKLDNGLIYDQIEKFLMKHRYNSALTEKAYRGDIELFFRTMKNKEIQYLTREDVQLTLDDFEDFIKSLYESEKNGEREYTNKTINRKVVSVKGIIRYLAAKKIVDDISYLELVESLPEHSVSHGVLESHEVFQMAELALKERYNGHIKRLIILFSFDTCARKNEVLSLKWSNFIEKEDGVLVKGVGKGNKEFRQKISKSFYSQLSTLNKGQEYVFSYQDKHGNFKRICSTSIDEMIRSFSDKMNISDSRHIVFHSIRKAGVTYRYRITGDILEAKRAANHSNLNTTQIYLQEEDYGALGAVSSAGNYNENLYNEVTHEELLNVISQFPNIKLLLNMKLQENLNKNNK